MASENQDFTMHSGDDKLIDITVSEDGSPKDITGSSITWKLSQTLGSTTLLTKTVGSGITITDAVNGVFRVTLAQADTEGLAGEYYHEAEVIDAASLKSTVTTGFIEIKQDQIE